MLTPQAIKDFQQRHTDWFAQFADAEFIYTLPAEISDIPQIEEWLGPERFAAECEFAELCFQHYAIGVRRGPMEVPDVVFHSTARTNGRRRPRRARRTVNGFPIPLLGFEDINDGIRALELDPDNVRIEPLLHESNHWYLPLEYPLLTRVPLRPQGFEVLQSLFPDRPVPNPRQIAAINQKLDKANARLLGIIGFLMTEPRFLTELQDLRQRYEALPNPALIRWPQHRPIGSARQHLPLGHPLNPEGRTPELDEYEDRLLALMDFWGLAALCTWDLPLPCPPQVPELPGPVAPSQLQQHGVSIWIPASNPQTDYKDLVREFRQQQQQAARDAGWPTGFVALKHHKQYAQMARYIFLQTCLMSRFPNGDPHGFVRALNELAASVLKITMSSVDRIRRRISQCRAGKRAKVFRRSAAS